MRTRCCRAGDSFHLFTSSEPPGQALRGNPGLCLRSLCVLAAASIQSCCSLDTAPVLHISEGPSWLRLRGGGSGGAEDAGPRPLPPGLFNIPEVT